jgi:hypothetical protein
MSEPRAWEVKHESAYGFNSWLTDDAEGAAEAERQGCAVTPLVSAPPAQTVAEVQGMLDRYRELAAFCELRGQAETDEMDAIEARLLSILTASPEGAPTHADATEAVELVRMALAGNQWNEWHRRARALLSRIPKEEGAAG